jgi:hypothetical protein
VRNILIDEYSEILSRVGATHMADEGAKVMGDIGLRWTCNVSGLSLSIGWAPAPDTRTGLAGYAMVPIARSTGATALMGNVWDLAVRHRAAALCDRVHVAYLEVADFTVWDRDCPCDHCSGRGYGRSPSDPCRTCEGTGKRQPAAPAPDPASREPRKIRAKVPQPPQEGGTQ